MKKYYLAYGSNLNVSQMKQRCPNAKPAGTAIIRNYELLFKGSKTGSYLTIEPKKGEKVPVAVWEVTESDEKRLDLYEGFPNFYYKKKIRLSVKWATGGTKRLTAFVYIMHEERKLGVPSRQYMTTCMEGYQDFGFDRKFLETAFRKSLKGVSKYES